MEASSTESVKGVSEKQLSGNIRETFHEAAERGRAATDKCVDLNTIFNDRILLMYSTPGMATRSYTLTRSRRGSCGTRLIS